jgi:hypothetical protein
LGFFNLQSAIVSVVGDDFPQEYFDLLVERNIDISGLEVLRRKDILLERSLP